MRELLRVLVLILTVVPAWSAPEVSAQTQNTDQTTPLPNCSGGTGKVQVQTAVWHIDSKTFITDLSHNKFRLNVPKQEPFSFQCFTEPDEPYTVGFVIDYSVSMPGGATRLFVEGFREFVKTANEKNTYFGIGFKTRPFTMLPPTGNQSEVEAFFVNAEKQGRSGDSSVNDAVQLGIDTMPAQNPTRRILILASDGEDNSSKKLSESKIVKALRQAGIRVFVVSLTRRSEDFAFDFGRGAERLYGYSGETGGGWLRGTFETGLARTLGGLSRMLRAEYTLGFTPSKIEEKWHELDYAVTVPKEFQKIHPTGAYWFYY